MPLARTLLASFGNVLADTAFSKCTFTYPPRGWRHIELSRSFSIFFCWLLQLTPPLHVPPPCSFGSSSSSLFLSRPGHCNHCIVLVAGYHEPIIFHRLDLISSLRSFILALSSLHSWRSVFCVCRVVFSFVVQSESFSRGKGEPRSNEKGDRRRLFSIDLARECLEHTKNLPKIHQLCKLGSFH